MSGNGGDGGERHGRPRVRRCHEHTLDVDVPVDVTDELLEHVREDHTADGDLGDLENDTLQELLTDHVNIEFEFVVSGTATIEHVDEPDDGEG
jgi:ligand-binding sensor protein